MNGPLSQDFQTLIENASDLVMIAQEGIVIYANPAAHACLGYEPAALHGRVAIELVHPDSRELIRQRMVLAAQGTVNRPYECRLLKRDGSPLSISGTSFSAVSNGRSALVLMGRDLTEHNEMEQQRKHIAAVLDSAPVAIFTVNSSMQVQHWNRTCETMSLWPPWQPGLRPPMSEENRLRMISACEQARQKGGTLTLTRSIVRAVDGLRADMRAWVSQVQDAQTGEEVFIFVMDDMTERVHLEKQTVELRDSLRRTEPLSAMGELVAGVAHEVRNPLFGMGAALDVIESRGGPPDKFLQILRGELDRLNRLMRDLLDYGKPPSANLTIEPLGPMLNAAVRACTSMAAEAGVSIAVTGVEPIAPFMMDGPRLSQVFQNLLANAIQHAPRGSEVRLEARQVGSIVEVRVADRGPGFRDEDLPRIFEPFFTRRRGGTGLGLAIVQRIVEQHGGEITAGSRLGGGAEVRVSLPGLLFQQ